MLINGEPANSISITDRGLAYGDGVFETFRIVRDKLLFEELHLQRLSRGCKVLGIALDLDQVEAELTTALRNRTTEAGIVKLIVTRGSSGRGYRGDPVSVSTRIITLHALPENMQIHAEQGIKAFVCRQRLSSQPSLAGIKHLNRLEQVIASGEWPDETCQEGIMLDMDGYVVEGTRSNIFIVDKGHLITDTLATCGIAGVMRQVIMQHFGGQVHEKKIGLEQFYAADEVYFCNSIFGVWPLRHLICDGVEKHYASGPFTADAQALFNEVVFDE